MKIRSVLLMLPMLWMACGCSSSSDDNDMHPTPIDPSSEESSHSASGTGLIGNLILNMSTDKARYNPGETVHFSVEGDLPSNARVRYRQAGTVVADEALSSAEWTWTPPTADFKGYLADIYTKDGETETIYGTIGVDVSSSWSRFPRYGFVADYDKSKTPATIAEETAFLNRCHINGIQYYDWQNKHHYPLGGTRSSLLDTYKDIANREVVTQVVKDYISAHHSYGMKTMFYNLCYGALDDAAGDGVNSQWRIFTDQSHSNPDMMYMPSGWKSNIYLMNPANTDWQQYLADRNDDVYANFDFDGFHIDQLGSRGTVYDFQGNSVNLPLGFSSFIQSMKTRHPEKLLVMNAVSNYAAKNIAQTGCMEFLYTELWSGEGQFEDLLKILKANSIYSGGSLNQVFAAYMNYNQQGQNFNAPGVLLTDAVMFAIGASHLELGDHMLCHEYFPNKSLAISKQLRQSLIHYYDFLTAYENLLRDGGNETVSTLTSTRSGITVNAWPPKLNAITTYSKTIGNTEVVHLLNFSQANSLSWRDLNSDMPEPKLISSLPLRMRATGVKRIWVATPDELGGAPQEIEFHQSGSYVTFTLPSLKYWTMIVIEK